MNPRKIRRELATQEDFDRAVQELYQQNEHSERSFSEIIEEDAGARLPRNLKVYFGLLARQLVDREVEPEKYRNYCRALGLGAYTGTLLAEKVYGNLRFFESAHIGLGEEELSPADAAILMVDGTQDALKEVGEPTRRWIDDRASEALIDDDMRLWYKVGATVTLEHVTTVVDTLQKIKYMPHIS